eukprot:1160995-Pelagomonas_calceolata.AAC.1
MAQDFFCSSALCPTTSDIPPQGVMFEGKGTAEAPVSIWGMSECPCKFFFPLWACPQQHFGGLGMKGKGAIRMQMYRSMFKD